MKKSILIIAILLVSCNNKDNPSNGGATGGECYKITYAKDGKMPFTEIERVKTTLPSTNGYIDNGGATFYQVKCF